tara:strand:- start:645 stop:1556 length:912 start_codon:yes stop_codon:yes gene_type:complete
MGMTCELSPLVFAELYSLLGDKTAWADTLEDRLADGGLDLAWLSEAAQMYSSYWDTVTAASPMALLPDDHAHLASWILAALRLKEPSDNFSDELRDRVLQRYSADTGVATGILPEGAAGIVVAWTLGKVVGEFDVVLPVVPAKLPSDDDIAAAYTGLVEHVGTLPKSTPWPEMLGSSAHWRSAGLAESLSPRNPPSLSSSIGQLVSESQRHMESRKYLAMKTHWNDPKFVPRRNVLTHVKSDGITFDDAAKKASEHREITPTIAGVTQFICQHVADELADPGNRPPWGNLWPTMQYDIGGGYS